MSRIGLWGVDKRRGGVLVLDGVSLAVAAGEVVVLGGARGAGQTTLLAVAAAVMAPDAGELELDGRRTTGLQGASLPYVRRNIGYLPSTPQLVPDETALENVMLALGARGLPPAPAEEASRAMLAALGLAPLADRSAASLSCPEQRLVAAARALVGRPPIIVLDEPSLGLDQVDRTRLVSAIGDARRTGSAILCGTSDPALAAALGDLGARLLRLEGGRIAGATGLRLVDAEELRPLPASGAGGGA